MDVLSVSSLCPQVICQSVNCVTLNDVPLNAPASAGDQFSWREEENFRLSRSASALMGLFCPGHTSGVCGVHPVARVCVFLMFKPFAEKQVGETVRMKVMKL